VYVPLPSSRCGSGADFPPSSSKKQTKARGFIATGAQIVKKETPLGLYKGLGAVVTGIVPKMAIRFASFEQYKHFLANKETGKTSSPAIFLGTSSSPSSLYLER
jgi:hypothetical protein